MTLYYDTDENEELINQVGNSSMFRPVDWAYDSKAKRTKNYYGPISIFEDIPFYPSDEIDRIIELKKYHI